MRIDDNDNEAAGMRLDHFLKISHISGSGGMAKTMIQSGDVKVNGETETRRRRKVIAGDVVEFNGQQFLVGKSGQ